MIYGSLILVLNLSITHGNSHKLASLMVLALSVLWESSSGHSEFIHVILVLLWNNVVGTDLLLNSSEVGILIHGPLCDWDHGVDHIPKDTFDKWSGCKGTLVSEPPVEIDQFDKLAKVERTLLGAGSALKHYFSVLLLIN